MEKWPIFDQNHGLTLLKKITIFRLFELLVFIAQKHLFSLQNIVKHIFLAYVAQKKEDGKMANFSPKPRINAFGIMTIFRFSELLVFIAQKHVFFLVEYRKTHFPGLYYLLKKRWKNCQFLTKTMDPLGKTAIFRLFELLVFIA